MARGAGWSEVEADSENLSMDQLEAASRGKGLLPRGTDQLAAAKGQQQLV